MPRFSGDGSVVPSQLRSNNDASYNSRFGLYPGIVKQVIYADSKENTSGDVEYTVNILGQNYYGVSDIRHSGGIHNSHVRVRKGVESVRLGGKLPSLSDLKPTTEPLPEDLDGDAVWCLFIRGNSDLPVIIGSRRNPREAESPDHVKPTKSEGIFERYEMNGVEFLIDKDGNFTVSQIGQKDAKLAGAMRGNVPKTPPYIKNPEAILPVPSVVTFGYNGDFGVSINEDQLRMTFTKSDNSWEVVAGAGTTISLDGTTDAITASTVTGSTMKLANGKVGLGGPGGELVDLLAQVTDQLIDTMTKLSTTMGNLGFPISTAADFTAMINKMVPIKTKIAAIKGGI
jgi:hypothetical protein